MTHHVFRVTELQVGFAYFQKRIAGTVESNFGFRYPKAIKNNVTWSIMAADKTVTFDVSSHVAFGKKASLDSHPNIESDCTSLVGVTAMFSVHSKRPRQSRPSLARPLRC